MKKKLSIAFAILATIFLAVAPFPQGIKIIGDIIMVERADHAETPAAGQGQLWVKNTTPSTLIYTNDAGSDTTLGSGGGGGAVDSVNGATGTVVLDTDDIAEGAAKYNATHTGEVTGATALTLGKTAITNRSTVTPATGDGFMFSDVSESDNLKKATLADILALISGLTDSQISDTLTASKVIGSGSTTDNVDAGTAELAGTVPYTKGGTGLTALGTANQVLRTNASGTAMEWATPSTGGDPTYGSNAGASDDAVYVDATNEVGIGTTTPSENLDIYATDNAPRIALRYYNAGGSGTDIDYAQSGTDSSAVGVIAAWYGNTDALDANDADYKAVNNATPGGDNKLTHYLLAKDYPIDIPTGATVDGIEFVVNGMYNEDDTPHACDDTYIRIIKGGTVQTIVNRASGTTWPQSSETTRTYGGPTDLWGTTWTESDVEADTFGLAMAFTMDDNDAMNIDYVTVKIYYTAGVAGDYVWTSGVDLSDGAWTLRADATDWIRVAYATGAVEFPGVIDVDGIKQDGVLYDLSTFGAGGVSGPVSSTSRAIAIWGDITGDSLLDTNVGIDASGNVTLASGDTVDGRELSTDGAKLDGIESGATADQTNAEIEAAFHAQVGLISQAAAEAGAAADYSEWSALRVHQAIVAQSIAALTGEVTATGPGSPAATLDKTAITNRTTTGPATGDYLLFSDISDTNNLKKDTVANFFALISGLTDAQISDTLTASVLGTPRAIYGNNFDGSAALTQIIASTYGGTGNGFTKFTGPASTEKTFTLPNASETIAALGQNQTWTGIQSLNSGKLTLNGSSSGSTILNAAAAASGTLTLPAATDTLVAKSTTDTLSNKRVTKRDGSTASSATPTINTDNYDIYRLTAQAADITSFTTNLTGAPNVGDQIRIQVTGTAARAITWGSSFSDGPATKPTTTVTTKTLYTLWEWDGSIWRCMATGSNP